VSFSSNPDAARRGGSSGKVRPARAGPFGQSVDLLTIPAWLARGADKDARPSAVEESAGAVRFDFGEHRYIYDRLGLRRWIECDDKEDLADA